MSKSNRKAVCVRQVGREVNGTTYCGRAADMYDESDFTFTDPNHALLSMATRTMKDGQRLEACPECRKAIAALLSGRIPKVVQQDTDDAQAK